MASNRQSPSKKPSPTDPKKKGKDKEEKPILQPSPRLATVLAQLEKTYGPRLILPTDGDVLDVQRIPSGIFELDHRLAGGFPKARFTIISGREGAAKSTALLKLVANYQRMCGRCLEYDADCHCPGGPAKPRIVWQDIERKLDLSWARRMGVQMKDPAGKVWFHPSRPDYAEQAVDVADALLQASEVGLFIMDSLAMLEPINELETSAIQQQRAERAKLIARIVNKANAIMARRERLEDIPPTFIAVQQLRPVQNVQVPAYHMPGGELPKYAASVILRLKQRGGGAQTPTYEWEAKSTAKDKAPLRAYTAFNVQKSCVSPPHLEGEFALVLRAHAGMVVGDTDDVDAVLYRAGRVGLLPRRGDAVTWAGQDYDNRDQLAGFWLNNRLDFYRAQRAVIEASYTKVEALDAAEESEGDGGTGGGE